MVHRDRLAVELDRVLDRLRRERQRAELIGVAEHEHVGADRLAEQRVGESRGVDEMGLLSPPRRR